MQDNPSAALLIAEVRKGLIAGIDPGFAQKVAANALGIAERELCDAPATSTQEYVRLEKLVGPEGNLQQRNRRLAGAIRNGSVSDDLLLEHLIRVTLAKIEVDQPSYPAFRAWQNRR